MSGAAVRTLLTAVVTATVWLLAAGLHWAPRAWLAVLLVPLPALMMLQARQLAELDQLPRRAAYASSMLSLWVLAGLTGLACSIAGIGPVELGLVALPLPRMLGWTALLTVAGVAVLFGFRLAGFRETPLMEQLMPASREDRRWFVGLSVTAGVTEEFVFRGFLVYALLTVTGSVPLALLLSSGAFGVVHAYQRPIGALRAALLGALLALPLVLDGSILPSILAHALIDLLSGLWLARYLLR